MRTHRYCCRCVDNGYITARPGDKHDSLESNEAGDDLPIELRHLEDGEDTGLLLGGAEPAQLPSKSRSLDDLTRLGGEASPRERRRLRDQVRGQGLIMRVDCSLHENF